jgi:hypothetical protein
VQQQQRVGTQVVQHQPNQVYYSVLMPGSEHLMSSPLTQQPQSKPVQHTSFSCSNQADYLCISPSPLNEAEVVCMPPQTVYSYCSQRNQLAFTGAHSPHRSR